MILNSIEYRNSFSPLLAGEDSEHQSQEMLARIVLSFLCEPGDRWSGALASEVSASVLVEKVLARADWSELSDALSRHSVENLGETFGVNLAATWAESLQRWTPRLSKQTFIESLNWMIEQVRVTGMAHWLAPADSSLYPPVFDAIEWGRPHALWGMGRAEVLAQPSAVAIVGARVASRYGVEVARDLAIVAAGSNLVTVSGGAYGIDEAVHTTSVKMESPTVSYMAGGLANLYPRGNQQLLLSIAKKGAVVTEMAPWVVPAKWRFLMRNRLIAAHGKATVVVEAGQTSGALKTARYALDFDRPVAVIPGPISSARSAGCHDLLNDNLGQVSLIARPQEILRLVGISSETRSDSIGIGSLERRALDSFQTGSLEAWEVQRLAGLTVVETQIALGSLELHGLVERVGTRYLRSRN